MNNVLKSISLMIVLALALCVPVHAQIDAQFTQHHMVPGYYNPSASGRTDNINVTVGSRLQWVGIRHAPMAFMALGDMPFKVFGKRLATQVVLQQQSMGLYRGLTAGAGLAYKQPLFGGQLGIGFRIGLVNETFKGSRIILPEGDDAHSGNDDAIPKTDVSGNAFDVGAGLFYEHRHWWAGASVLHITEPTVELKAEGNEEDIYEFKQGRVAYFMAGGNIPIKNTLFELQPSALVKTNFNFFQGEAALRVRYNKFLNGGVAYRWKDAVSVMIGAEFKQFTVGYAYDYPISSISKATTGSHELFIGYKVKLNLGQKNKNAHKSIRLM